MTRTDRKWYNRSVKKTLIAAVAVGAACLSFGATVDLVSAKGVDATAWLDLESPGEGALTATVQAPDGFKATLLRVVKEPRDPNAFFTDVPGIGNPVPVGVALADAAKGAPAKAGESVRFRIVIPVAETAADGVHKGKVTLSCGGKTSESELSLKVLDFALPPAKTRYSGRAWVARLDGVPAEWTVETADTYAKHAAEAKDVVGSLWHCTGDLNAERWRAFGVGYYAALDIPVVVNPDVWRRAAGIRAWQLGFDGVALPKDRKVEPIVLAGLEDAAIDVRYASYAWELSNALADKAKHASKIVYEGRMGQFFVDRIRTATDDMDVVRLELQARLVRLLAFTRKEASK